KAKLPPGFRDASKEDDPLHKFGDLIVWRQLLDKVREAKAPFVIFATDDSKNDWWLKQDGKTIGPHPSLIHEAKREANCRAYLYPGDQFIKYGAKHFGLKADEKLIAEAATVRQEIRLPPSPLTDLIVSDVARVIGQHRGFQDSDLLMELARTILQ